MFHRNLIFREKNMDTKEKKSLAIYVAIAYGITFLMCFLMKIGLNKGIDLTSFVNVQMMYPALGVIIAKLVTKEAEEKLPIAGYIIFIVGTALMMIIAILSVVFPIPMIGTVDVYNLISQIVIILMSVPLYIIFWVCNKEAKENAGIRRKNIWLSVGMIALFIVLYFARFAIGNTLSGIMKGNIAAEWNEWFGKLNTALQPDSTTGISVWLLTVITLPINFFFVFSAFFGEEYGWRYYLQPLLQKKLGMRKGVLLLGLVWAVWHIGADFMFYTTSDGPQMFVGQIVTCISIGIFFGYAYMKTQNIWVPVIMHFLNNNMVLILAASADANVLQNQSVSWADIPIAIVQSLVFVAFIVAKEYRKAE